MSPDAIGVTGRWHYGDRGADTRGQGQHRRPPAARLRGHRRSVHRPGRTGLGPVSYTHLAAVAHVVGFGPGRQVRWHQEEDGVMVLDAAREELAGDDERVVGEVRVCLLYTSRYQSWLTGTCGRGEKAYRTVIRVWDAG